MFRCTVFSDRFVIHQWDNRLPPQVLVYLLASFKFSLALFIGGDNQNDTRNDNGSCPLLDGEAIIQVQ